MKASKSDLADLKRLRIEAQAATRTPEVRAPSKTSAARERSVGDAVPSGVRGTVPTAATPASTTALQADDHVLFRQAMRFVRPLRATGARAPGRVRLAPDEWLQARRLHAEGDQRPPPAPSTMPATRKISAAHYETDMREFLRSGCGPDLLRGLRRGKWPIEATLDLHGSTLEQARTRLDRFLTSCLDHDIRCVRIVHGKGYGSQTGIAVLKDAVRRYLSQLEATQAWVQCKEPEGGAGAVMALLRLTLDKDML